MRRLWFAVLLLFLLPASAHAAVPTCGAPAPQIARSGVSYVDAFPCAGAADYRVTATSHLNVQKSYDTSFTVAASSNYSGPASFTFIASNADGDAAPVTVTYTVATDANRPPTCDQLWNPVRRGETRDLEVSCSDPEGDRVAESVETPPASGAVNVTGTTVRYTAPASGDGSFTLAADDDHGGHTSFVVVPYLTPATSNTAPSCQSPPISYLSQGVVQIRVFCQDADGDPLSATVSGADHGTFGTPTLEPLDMVAIVYTPDTGYSGPETAQIVVHDDHGGDVTIPYAFTVDPAPPPFSCFEFAQSPVRPGQSAMAEVSCSGSVFTPVLKVIDPPKLGTIDDGIGTFIYTAGDTPGADSFTVAATADGVTQIVTVPITVDADANGSPSCSFSSFPIPGQPVNHQVRAGQTSKVSFQCGDPDGDPIHVTTTDPTHGSLRDVSFDGAKWTGTYVPADGYTGTDSFSVTASDDRDASTSATEAFTVREADFNTLPQCSSYGSPTPGPRVGETFTIGFYCNDADGDPITFTQGAASNASLVSAGYHDEGILSMWQAVVRGGDTAGPASIQIIPSDTAAGSPIALTFDVRPADADIAPVCSAPPPPYAIERGEHRVLQLGNECSDADSDALAVTITDPPAHGTLTRTGDPVTYGNGEMFAYLPDDGYVGDDSIGYDVSDGHGGTVHETQPLVVAADGVNTVIEPAAATAPARATVRFSSPGHPDATFLCGLDREPSHPCTSPYTTQALADGTTHDFRVVAEVGDTRDPTPAYTYWITDAVAPADPTLESHTIEADHAAFQVDTGDGTLECRLDSAHFAACDGDPAYTDLPDGDHDFAARAVDAAGNTSDTVTYDWTVDTTPPDTEVTAGPPTSTYKADASLAFAGGDGFECSLDGGAYAACTSPAQYSVAPGDHTFAVRGHDTAGNVSTPAERKWTVKAVPTGEQVAEDTVGTGGGTVKGVAASVTVPADLGGGTVSVLEGGAPSGDAPAGYTFIGRQTLIEAPAATAAAPLRLAFDIEQATLDAASVTAGTVAVVRDGVTVAPCTGPAGEAAPDPCVADRQATATGAHIVVLSSHASKWDFAKADAAAATPTATPDPTSSPTPDPTPTPSATPTATVTHVDPPAADTTPPAVTLSAARQHTRRVARHGLRLTVGCDEPCTAAVAVRLGHRKAGGLMVPLAGADPLRVPLGAAVKRKLRRARKATLTVTVVAVDAAGNPTTRVLRVVLHR